MTVPQRLRVAAHESGHVLAFIAAGVPFAGVHVDPDGLGGSIDADPRTRVDPTTGMFLAAAGRAGEHALFGPSGDGMHGHRTDFENATRSATMYARGSSNPTAAGHAMRAATYAAEQTVATGIDLLSAITDALNRRGYLTREDVEAIAAAVRAGRYNSDVASGFAEPPRMKSPATTPTQQTNKQWDASQGAFAPGVTEVQSVTGEPITVQNEQRRRAGLGDASGYGFDPTQLPSYPAITRMQIPGGVGAAGPGRYADGRIATVYERDGTAPMPATGYVPVPQPVHYARTAPAFDAVMNPLNPEECSPKISAAVAASWW